MNKSQLKTGMIIERRDGVKGVVLLNTGTTNGYKNAVVFSTNNNYNIKELNNSLEYNGATNADITKVYKPQLATDCLDFHNNFANAGLTLLWERDDTREMTLAEVCGELGYNVKITK